MDPSKRPWPPPPALFLRSTQAERVPLPRPRAMLHFRRRPASSSNCGVSEHCSAIFAPFDTGVGLPSHRGEAEGARGGLQPVRHGLEEAASRPLRPHVLGVRDAAHAARDLVGRGERRPELLAAVGHSCAAKGCRGWRVTVAGAHLGR